MRLTEKNAEKVVEAGEESGGKSRMRGSTARRSGREISRMACSHNAEAMKNHYLMTQISDMVKQLYEWFVLEAGGIRKRAKKYIFRPVEKLWRAENREGRYKKE